MVQVTIPRSQYDILITKLVPGSGPHDLLKNGVFDEEGNLTVVCEQEELNTLLDFANALCPEVVAAIVESKLAK